MSIPARIRRLRRRLSTDAQKGSAAIEFAFVAPVFFMFLFGIFEAAILFFSQAALQTGVAEAGRMIRTGQSACVTQNNGGCTPMTEAQFKQQICDMAAPLLPGCTTGLVLNVQNYPAGFGNIPMPNPLSPNTGGAGPNNSTLTIPDTFSPGGACDVVVVRAFYGWGVLTPLVTPFLANMAGGKYLLTSATAFRNEPFAGGNGGC